MKLSNNSFAATWIPPAHLKLTFVNFKIYKKQNLWRTYHCHNSSDQRSGCSQTMSACDAFCEQGLQLTGPINVCMPGCHYQHYYFILNSLFTLYTNHCYMCKMNNSRTKGRSNSFFTSLSPTA